MNKIVVFLSFFMILIVVSCNKNDGDASSNQENITAIANNKLSGKVLEVLNVDKYTYVRIKNNSKELWIAGPKENIKIGDSISIKSGMLMKNFISKTLNKTFDKIYFVGSLTGKPSGGFHGGSKMSGGNSYHSGGMNKRIREELETKYKIKKIDKVEGGYSIEELYQKKSELNGKKIKLKALVVKFSPEIMNRNWIHLRDGSGKTNNNDITVTTNEKVKTGDIITIEGILAVDKDFGYGYKYSLIIENSKIIK